MIYEVKENMIQHHLHIKHETKPFMDIMKIYICPFYPH